MFKLLLVTCLVAFTSAFNAPTAPIRSRVQSSKQIAMMSRYEGKIWDMEAKMVIFECVQALDYTADRDARANLPARPSARDLTPRCPPPLAFRIVLCPIAPALALRPPLAASGSRRRSAATTTCT
jgi:hypothetical protein